jgi:hypothetical protein
MGKLFQIIIFSIFICIIISNDQEQKHEQDNKKENENENHLNDNNSTTFNLSNEIEKLYYDNMNNTENWQYMDPLDHNETFYNEIEEINEPTSKEPEEQEILRLEEERMIKEWEEQVENFKPEELLTIKLSSFKIFVSY